MPGTKITDEDCKEINKKFICTICNLLLCMPMQTPCGHLMCLTCLQTLLESSDARCPEDGTELKKDQAFPDVFTKRELKVLCLHCPNPGCPWHGTYEQLEAHVETNCEEAPLPCPYCKETIVRRNIERHERVSCVDYEIKCQYASIGCNKTIKRKDFVQHLKDALIDHANLQMSYINNFSVAQHWNGAQDRPRAQFTEASEDLGSRFQNDERARMEHLLTTPKTLIRDLTAECQRLQERNTSLERKISDMISGRRMEQIKSFPRVLGNSRERNMSLEREMGYKMSIPDMDHVDESLALNTVKIADMKSQRAPRAQETIHSYNGTLLWKIDGCKRKRQDAINGVKTALYSDPFYSSQFGYKICAKIYMNGDGFGKGSHLSLFFVVMRGDYDALQTWPFQKKITMMLLDQGNGDHMIDAFHPDPQSSSFQRPKSNMNIASGCPLFRPLDSLNNRQYIKDEVMFIKIVVGDVMLIKIIVD